jgi:hypothetical protein
MVIDYERCAAEYEASLVTKLRGHGAGSFLESWVPDPDPVLGIFNMIEAAWTAGRNEVALSVARTTLNAASLNRLRELAQAFAELQVHETADAYRLDVRRADRGARTVKASALPPATSASARNRQLAKVDARRVGWPIHPSLVDALNAETSTFTHEGEHSEEGTVSLTVDSAGTIRTARHRGVRPQVRHQLVEVMCRAIEGRTVLDASDHAGSLAVHRLRLRAGKRGAEGVLLPANAGTEVVAALEMIRNACRRGVTGTENFFELGPGTAWSELATAEKLRRAVEATVAFCRAEGVSDAMIKPVCIEKDIHGHEIRFIIQIDQERAEAGVPLLLRRLERFLKAQLEEALQVYLEPLKDKNVLRRL